MNAAERKIEEKEMAAKLQHLEQRCRFHKELKIAAHSLSLHAQVVDVNAYAGKFMLHRVMMELEAAYQELQRRYDLLLHVYAQDEKNDQGTH